MISKVFWSDPVVPTAKKKQQVVKTIYDLSVVVWLLRWFVYILIMLYKTILFILSCMNTVIFLLFVQKTRELPFFIKRMFVDMMDPDRNDSYLHEMRLFAVKFIQILASNDIWLLSSISC